MLKGYRSYLAAALTAPLIVLSYPKFSFGWLAWLALAPLAYFLLKARSARAAAAGGLLCGFLTYLGLLYWIYPTMRAGGVGPAVSALGLVLLAAVLSLEFVLFSLYGFYLRKAGPRAWPWLFALGWYLLEYGKVQLAMKAVWFPWFMLGYTQWSYTPIIQIASVAGVYGLSAALALSGALAASALASDGPAWRRALRFSPALLALAGLWLFGRRELASAGAPDGTLGIALLQPSIDQYAKWDASQEAAIERTMEELSARAAGAELTLWPENALPCWIDEPACYAWLKKAVSPRAGYSLVGSVSKGGGKHVSALLLDGKGAIAASYNKRLLVPFGEYVPLRGLLGKFIAPVAELGEFEPGAPDQPLFALRGLKLGVAVCYESIFPPLFTGDAAQGADLFVNITNDGWYLDTSAPYQHFAANVLRAVETRRSLARAANNGVSGLIDPWGRVTARTALNERTVLEVSAPVHKAPSAFTLYGGRITLAVFLAVAAFLLAVLFI